MLSVKGYYNGQEFVALENTLPRKNQKVIITFLDDFIDAPHEKPYKKYVGKLDAQSYQEIMLALDDCEKVDAELLTCDRHFENILNLRSVII